MPERCTEYRHSASEKKVLLSLCVCTIWRLEGENCGGKNHKRRPATFESYKGRNIVLEKDLFCPLLKMHIKKCDYVKTIVLRVCL